MTAAIVAADGPTDPPSSRPRAGVLGGQVYAYRFRPADGVQRIDLPMRVDPDGDTVLRWAFYADGDDATQAPYAALAVTVDVRTDDGSRLSDDPDVRDRYGCAVDADSQFSAAWSMPEQWNEDAVMLAPLAGAPGTVELVVGADGLVGEHEVSGFFEAVVERAALPDDGTPSVDRVDTRRGSHAGDRYSRGNTIPAAAVPHGFAFLTPATDAADSRWPYRPFVHDDPEGRRLEAVQFSHQPSPWIGDRGVLQVMPFSGEPTADRAARRRWIRHGTEQARPHAYSAELDGGLRLTAVPTSHGAAFRVTAPDAAQTVGLVLDQLTDDGELVFADDGSFTGWVPEGDPRWGNAPRTYFAGRSVTEIASAGALDDGERPRVAGAVTGTGAVEVRIALSFLSVDQARGTLARELDADASIESLRDAAAREWDPLLSQVSIPPLAPEERSRRGLADAEHRAAVAGALYRMHLYPNTMSENVGTGESPQWAYADPMTPASEHTATQTGARVRHGQLMVNNGYWDTYRTVCPALALLDPNGTAALVDGLLEQYRAGGWMARWSAPGYVDSMVGTSSDQIFADAERWHVPGDHASMLASGVRNAMEPAADPRWGRKGIARARFLGWVSSAVREGMSWSLENAISDAGLARLARRLADSGAGDDAAAQDALSRYLANRSLAYAVLFDPASGFFRGRDDAGSFADGPFDPRVWGGDYVETNAWGMSVSAVHDGAGLAALYGGPSALGRHLDALFREPETADDRFAGTYRRVIHEQREARGLRAGMCAVSNQPAHHIPQMYAFTDRPWLAGARTRELAARLFAGTAIAQGFPGDEDNGEMSAWWLWAALGLYPLELGSGQLRIGLPLLDDVTVTRSTGTTLRVRVDRSAPGDAVVAIRCNGVELDQPVLDVDALDHDVDLEIVLGHDPGRSPLWRGREAPSRQWQPDLTPNARVSAGARALVDDGDPSGDDGVEVSSDGVEFVFDEPVTVTDLSVTTLDPTLSDRLRWSVSDDGTAWTELALTHAQHLAADRTAPFRVARPIAARRIRLQAGADVRLRQVELFSLDG